jgi:hypothetical protein
LTIATIPALGLALFFATARYGVESYHGIRYISRSPVASITWGPANSYIVQHGINRVSDQGLGMAGNFIEFPVSPHTRVSMRLFSFRWLAEEFYAWRSDHEWARPRCARQEDESAAAVESRQKRHPAESIRLLNHFAFATSG